MDTLYERLLEVCRDQKIERPIGVDIQRVTGLSSGRITQIKGGGNTARLGDDALRKLIRLGYSPDWLQDGRLPKLSPIKGSGSNTVNIESGKKRQDPAIAAVIALMEATDATGRAIALNHVQLALDKYKPAKPNRAS